MISFDDTDTYYLVAGLLNDRIIVVSHTYERLGAKSNVKISKKNDIQVYIYIYVCRYIDILCILFRLGLDLYLLLKLFLVAIYL